MRERIGGDIDKLSDYLIKKYCRKLDKELKHLSTEAREAFNIYNWPGNVRELENVIEYLVNVVGDREIKLEHLPYNIKEYLNNEDHKADSLKKIIDDYEKSILRSYLKTYGNTTKDKEKKSVQCWELIYPLYIES